MSSRRAGRVSEERGGLVSSFLGIMWSLLTRVPRVSFILLQLCCFDVPVATLVSFLLSGGTSASSALRHLHQKHLTLLSAAYENGTVSTYLRTTTRGLASVLISTDAQRLVKLIQTENKLAESLQFVWKNPQYALFAFGTSYIFLTTLVTLLRFLFHCTCGVVNKLRGRRGGRNKMLAHRLYAILRYPCGHDACIRLLFAVVEMGWCIQRVRYLSAVPQVALRGGGGSAKGSIPHYHRTPHHNHTLWRVPKNSTLVTSRIPTLFTEQASSDRQVLLAVIAVLVLTIVMELQRLFNALVGVRPLSVPDGFSECPLCWQYWRVSRRRAPPPHYCPKLLPVTEDERDELVREVADDKRGVTNDSFSISCRKARRTGDVFPEPDKASWLSTITYSWLNPVLNVSLISPFGLFDSPAPDNFKDGGKGLREAQDRVVERLPSLPASMRTREAIDEPAWSLWNNRYKSVREAGDAHPLTKRGYAERFVWWVTWPLRVVMRKAFALFFLPPPAPASSLPDAAAAAAAAGVGEGQVSSAVQRPPPTARSLFDLFLQHPSGREYVFVCAPLKICQDVLSVVSPWAVRYLVTFLREVGMNLSDSPESFFGTGFGICALLVVVQLLQVVFFQSYLSHLYASSTKASSAIKTLLLHQTLTTPAAYAPSTGDGAAEAGAATVVNVSTNATGGGGGGSSSARGGRREGRAAFNAVDSPVVQDSTGGKKVSDTGKAAGSTVSRDGEAVSLLTVDASNCGDCLVFLHNVWGHPLVILSSLLSMYSYVGLFSTLTTFAMLVMLVPVNRSSAARVRVAQEQAKNNGARLSDLTTAFTYIRTVKALALEKCIMRRTAAARTKESEGRERVIYAESLAAAQTEMTTLLISIVCFGTYLLSGGKMDATVLVPTMAALNVMRFPVWSFPHLFSIVSHGYNSMKRIEKYLSHHKPVEEPHDDDVANNPEEEECPEELVNGAVRCEDCSFSWGTPKPMASIPSTMNRSASFSSSFRERSGNIYRDGAAPMPVFNAVLHNVDLDIKPGEFVVVQGPTASGKSALLLSMLGELWPIPASDSASIPECTTATTTAITTSLYSTITTVSTTTTVTATMGSTRGGFRIGGSVAYCAESPWLRNLTLRENIRMRQDSDDESEEERAWYTEVLRACALSEDIEALPLGDRTIVGEAGGKLSGGQRARVAIARAVLCRDTTDVFIFDDVLSALDVEVQRHIIAEVFHGLLRPDHDEGGNGVGTSKLQRKTIVFATHVNADLLMPDRVLNVSSDGLVIEARNRTPTEAHNVRARKLKWRALSATAREAKLLRQTIAQKRSEEEVRSEEGAPTAPLFEAPENGSDFGSESEKQMITDVEAERRAQLFLNSSQPKSFTLFPSRRDLYTLFIEYAGVQQVLVVLCVSVLMEVQRIFMDNWMGIWLSLHREAYDENTLSGSTLHKLQTTFMNVKSFLAKRQPPPPPPSRYTVALSYLYSLNNATSQFLFFYALIGITAALFSFLRTRKFYGMYQRITDTLQMRVVGSFFHAPASFFDRTPLSSLLNTLSRDQDVVDRLLGESIQLIFLSALQLLSINFFNAARYAGFIVVLPFTVLLFYHLTLRFLIFTKQVRSLEGRLHSRSVEVLKEAVKGAVTVRAFGPQVLDQLQLEMDDALDAVHTAASAGLAADRWVALRLEMVSLVTTAALAFLAVCSTCFGDRSGTLIKTRTGVRVDKDAVTASATFAGLGIISTMTAARSMSMLCRRMGMFQNQYVSCEQLLRVEREVPEEVDADPTLTAPRLQPGEELPATKDEEQEGGGDSPMEVSRQVTDLTLPLLDVRHLSGKYQEHLPWVLKDVTFSLRSGECIGLIGRTGNGKSSIFSSLLRLMDVLEGEILIQAQQGGDAAAREEEAQDATGSIRMGNALGLSAHALRKYYFELVSQEPLLLQGTCRSNLTLGLEDEAESLDDARLWGVLQKVSLDELLLAPWSPAVPSSPRLASQPNTQWQRRDGSRAGPAGDNPLANDAPTETHGVEGANGDAASRVLEHFVQAGGANLSAGQRQLLCLARALLHDSKVVLLDEVSSKVDAETDMLIQRVIKEELLQRRSPGSRRKVEQRPPCGVLLIAHRLETIMSLCDRVLVIEQGKCVASLSKEEVESLEDLQSYL